VIVRIWGQALHIPIVIAIFDTSIFYHLGMEICHTNSKLKHIFAEISESSTALQ